MDPPPTMTADESEENKISDDVGDAKEGEDFDGVKDEVDDGFEEEEPKKSPSMTVALFVTWILPILIIAVFSRFGVDTEPPRVKLNNRPISIDTTKFSSPRNPPTSKKNVPGMMAKKKKQKKEDTKSDPAAAPTVRHPTSYRMLLDDIQDRKRLWKPRKVSSSGVSGPRGTSAEQPVKKSNTKQAPSSSPTSSKPRKPSATSPNSRYPSSLMRDPQRTELDQAIETRRLNFKKNRSVLNAIDLADSLRMKDLKYHDGGMGQQEALNAYQFAIDETIRERQAMQERGEVTSKSKLDTNDVSQELMLDYTEKSVDGLLCALYTGMGKMYFMANMFERAAQAYSACIELEPHYLDAVTSRGSTEIILGNFELAGKDFVTVLEHDKMRMFKDAFTGLAKVLVAKEDAVPVGWGTIVELLEPIIAEDEARVVHAGSVSPEVRRVLTDSLNRLHHVLFTYHDTKTKNREKAWYHLTEAYKHKMSSVEPYNFSLEAQKLATIKAVFHSNFWPEGIGSSTKLPIFVIGFVRTGSTLLERVLDAHPLIVGTGEDSVFNGRLEQIRNEIVKTSVSGDTEELKDVVEELAESVAKDMRDRWKAIDANTSPQDGSRKDRVEPKRFADKMLTNYFNVGFIHMLFPNALILHVARNPMDVLWSAYKHEFPAGGLDYTSEFESLASMYHLYREVIKHWDQALPGRVTHVRYEDMVHDMPGVAKAIIEATGLPWDESVLSFHKMKHAVNTLSTTQVRKGVYKDGLEAWKKYETQLQPLVKLVGVEAKWDLKTSLPTYIPPPKLVE